MLAQQRQEAILREVERVGGARVSELVDLLGVSDMMVRRDIEALAVNGLVMKVHRGATAVVGRSAEEPGFHLLHNPQHEDLTVVLTGGMRTPSDVLVTDAELDCEARRIVSEQVGQLLGQLVGQLIEAQPFVGEADDSPRKVKSS